MPKGLSKEARPHASSRYLWTKGFGYNIQIGIRVKGRIMESMEDISNQISKVINDQLLGERYSLPFLPETPSSWSWILTGLFEPIWCPSRALNLASYIASLNYGHHQLSNARCHCQDTVKNNWHKNWLCENHTCLQKSTITSWFRVEKMKLFAVVNILISIRRRRQGRKERWKGVLVELLPGFSSQLGTTIVYMWYWCR